MKKGISVFVILFMLLAMVVSTASAASSKGTIGINVVLTGDITKANLATLAKYGKVRDVVYEIDALTMQIKAANLKTIRALKFVASATSDSERTGAPLDTVSLTDFSDGVSSWDLDAINVTDDVLGRTILQDGTGVYIAVLDTGLLDSWRQYFPQERIAEEFAIAFGGGGGEVGWVSSQPEKWQHDQNSHGTHVTSTILGYQMPTRIVNGVAPMATVIPVKVLNQNGSGWSSVVARGIVYVANLKKSGDLGDSTVVINMSLGGSVLDAAEEAAIDYAVENGVIIVASAGNSGPDEKMGYPGAYEPVISVASATWLDLGTKGWRGDVIEENMAQFTVSDFSSRRFDGQDLDLTAPGDSVVGPYQINSGQISYYYLSGTSMASPHIAGIVALMVQKDPDLTATEAEAILESVALDIPNFTDVDFGSGFVTADAALAATP